MADNFPALTWRTHLMASALHGAELVRLQKPKLAPALVEAFSEPVEKLRLALEEEQIPIELFWQRVAQVAADTEGTTPLADLALTKILGSQEAKGRASRFAALLQMFRLEFQKAFPQHHDFLAQASQPIRNAWSILGQGLLGQMANWTDPQLLVEQATVVAMPPLGGGGGRAFLTNNRVHLEVAEVEPNAKLPEVLRLAWLLSQLNLDLPRFSENVLPRRRDLVAQLAMIPVALKAGEIMQLLPKKGFDLLAEASALWVYPNGGEGKWGSILKDWWEVYETMRPGWPQALLALDHLLADAEGMGKSSQAI